MQKRPLFERWIGAGSCEDFGRKHGLQGDSRHVAARIDGDRPVPVLRPARNRLQCLAPTARSAGDIGPFGSLAISLFNDRETDIAGLLQRIAEPVVQCFAIEGKISIECQGRPGHLMPAVRAEYRVPTRKRRRRTFGGGEVSGHVRSEEHTSELQSLMRISYAVFCLKTK